MAEQTLNQAPLRSAAKAIYDTVSPSSEWTPVPFDEAERLQTVHYRNAVAAARYFQPVEQGGMCRRVVRPHVVDRLGEAEAEELTPEKIIQRIFDRVEVP